MKNDSYVSDEYLNAFIDGQLSEADQSRVFGLIKEDDSLKARVCELRDLKELVRHGYRLPAQPNSTCRGRLTLFGQAVAAVLLLAVGAAGGWVAHAFGGPGDLNRLIQNVQRDTDVADPSQFIVQVGSSDPVRLKNALDETENLLESSRRNGRSLQVEIIANGSGVDLLRADTSPFAQRIGAMKKEYPNLDFLACGQTLKKLREAGIDVQLLPNTGVATSAADQITRRLKQKWAYLRV